VGAQNEKSDSGGARARNERFYKETYSENSRFLIGVLKMRNLTLAAPGLEMIDFLKRRI